MPSLALAGLQPQASSCADCPYNSPPLELELFFLTSLPRNSAKVSLNPCTNRNAMLTCPISVSAILQCLHGILLAFQLATLTCNIPKYEPPFILRESSLHVTNTTYSGLKEHRIIVYTATGQKAKPKVHLSTESTVTDSSRQHVLSLLAAHAHLQDSMQCNYRPHTLTAIPWTLCPVELL
jgi:hypothetical protein